jgi:hypothetical protein
MGTQREIADKIVEKDGDYILCVKGNQGHSRGRTKRRKAACEAGGDG